MRGVHSWWISRKTRDLYVFGWYVCDSRIMKCEDIDKVLLYGDSFFSLHSAEWSAWPKYFYFGVNYRLSGGMVFGWEWRKGVNAAPPLPRIGPCQPYNSFHFLRSGVVSPLNLKPIVWFRVGNHRHIKSLWKAPGWADARAPDRARALPPYRQEARMLLSFL